MIRTAYLAPTETPPTLLEVKRALLTYDRVYIADPNDRDLIPPQSFLMALGLPPFIGFNTGPVRPLGKAADFDNHFDQLLDGIQIARREGLIDIVSTYDLTSSSKATIGAVQMGDYPLNPRLMLLSYRSIAREPTILRAAIEGDTHLMALPDEEIAILGGSGRVSADGGINADPALPALEGDLHRERLRDSFTSIARARIAATLKSIGYCAAKDMVPVFAQANSNELVNSFALRATRVLDKVAEEDPYWSRRRRALEIAHDEYLDEQILDRMSIDDVLKLRTTVWGKQAEARDALLSAVAELAREAAQETDFDETIRERITQYRNFADDLQKQRSSLSFTVRCELAKGIAGAASSGVLSQLQTAMGAGTLLLACLWAIDKIQDLKPAADQLRSAENEFSDNVCFGLHNFYRRVGRAVGSNVLG